MDFFLLLFHSNYFYCNQENLIGLLLLGCETKITSSVERDTYAETVEDTAVEVVEEIEETEETESSDKEEENIVDYVPVDKSKRAFISQYEILSIILSRETLYHVLVLLSLFLTGALETL